MQHGWKCILCTFARNRIYKDKSR